MSPRRGYGFWFLMILGAAVLGGLHLFLNSRAYRLRAEIDELRRRVVEQEEMARRMAENWRLATAPHSLESLAAERLELVVPEELETVTVE
jgi:hypothetical protein